MNIKRVIAGAVLACGILTAMSGCSTVATVVGTATVKEIVSDEEEQDRTITDAILNNIKMSLLSSEYDELEAKANERWSELDIEALSQGLTITATETSTTIALGDSTITITPADIAAWKVKEAMKNAADKAGEWAKLKADETVGKYLGEMTIETAEDGKTIISYDIDGKTVEGVE